MKNPELEIGDRVTLIHMSDESQMKPGTSGKVTGKSVVFGNTQYSVDWDNGSKLALLSDTDAWMKEEDWNRKLGSRKRVSEALDADTMRKHRDLLKDFQMNEIHRYMNHLKDSGIVNMFGSGPYLYMGSERISHQHFYDESTEDLDYVLEHADHIKDLMIQGALKDLERRGKETSLENVQRTIKNKATEIVQFLFSVH